MTPAGNLVAGCRRYRSMAHRNDTGSGREQPGPPIWRRGRTSGGCKSSQVQRVLLRNEHCDLRIIINISSHCRFGGHIGDEVAVERLVRCLFCCCDTKHGGQARALTRPKCSFLHLTGILQGSDSDHVNVGFRQPPTNIKLSTAPGTRRLHVW